MPDIIEYYDSVAADYDEILGKNSMNKAIRATVAKKFSEIVEKGVILDFGGGTGGDLPWLTEQGYQVIFLEPSSKMREVAIKNNKHLIASGQVGFLKDDETKIHNWSDHAPFGPVNGVLSNFAVLNNIADLKETFEKLSRTMRQGGSIIALVLKANFRRFMKISFPRTIKNLFTRHPFIVVTRYQDKQQTVYLHTLTEIKKTSSLYFSLNAVIPIKSSEFILLHLKRI